MPTPEFDHLWNYGDPAGTEARLRDLLPTLADADLRLQLHTQIARAQGLQRQFDAAHATLDQVERELTPDTRVARIRYLLERGRLFNSSGSPATACPLFEQAFEQAAQDDFYAVDAAHMLGIAATKGDERLKWNLRALALAEASTHPRTQQWAGSLYNNLGWTYHDDQRFVEALDVFQRALRFREAQGQAESIRIAQWCVARALRSLGRIDEALPLLYPLLPFADGYTYEEVGECLLLQQQAEEAKPYFAKAHALLSADEWLVANEPARLERLQSLSQ